MPSLPSLQASQRQSDGLKMANDYKLARSDGFMKQAHAIFSEDYYRLSHFRSLQRLAIEKERKQEKLDQLRRMRVTNNAREARWCQKLADHPFSRDLWKEDVKIYDRNRAKDAAEQKRRKDTLQREIEDRGNQIKKKCTEVDELEVLRKERRCLLENHKVLKTRLDIERKNIRSGVVPEPQPQMPPKATPEAAVSASSFFISPTRHGAVTCRPKSVESRSVETEVACPLEESATAYYTKWSGEKSQGDVQGAKNSNDASNRGDSIDQATTPKDRVSPEGSDEQDVESLQFREKTRSVVVKACYDGSLLDALDFVHEVSPENGNEQDAESLQFREETRSAVVKACYDGSLLNALDVVHEAAEEKKTAEGNAVE